MILETSRNQSVKKYIDHLFCPVDEILELVNHCAIENDFPSIHISPHVGKLIHLLAKIQGSRRILEIGTLAGYSTIWLARALPAQNGKLISLEVNSHDAAIARMNVKEAGLSSCVEIREGEAISLLSLMIKEKEEPFDFIFIDADKKNNQQYVDLCLKLARPYSLILIDNLIPKGGPVGYPCSHEAKFILDFNQYLAQHPQLETVLIPSIGENGHLDGLGISRVLPS